MQPRSRFVKLWIPLLLMLTSPWACGDQKAPAPSAVAGWLPGFAGRPAIPRAVTFERLGLAVEAVARRAVPVATSLAGSAAAKSYLAETLLAQVAAEGGMPRWQVRALVVEVLSGDSTRCGGMSCSRLFGLPAEHVDGWLSELETTVLKDPRLKDADHRPVFERILASLQDDLNAAPGKAPEQSVAFNSEAMAVSVRDTLKRGPGPVTYGDLRGLSHLEVDGRGVGLIDFADLGLMPNLKSLTLVMRDARDVEGVARIAHRLTALEIKVTPSSLGAYGSPRLADFRLFGLFPSIKRLTLTDLNLAGAETLPRAFPGIEYLELSQRTYHLESLSDDVLRAVGRMNNLKKLAMDVGDFDQLEDLTYTLPTNVLDVTVTAGSVPRELATSGQDLGKVAEQLAGECGNLSALRIFAKAQSMTVKFCRLEGLGGFGQPVAWKILKLDHASFHRTGPHGERLDQLSLSLTPELPKLEVFASNSAAVFMDESSRHEMLVRLVSNNRPARPTRP